MQEREIIEYGRNNKELRTLTGVIGIEPIPMGKQRVVFKRGYANIPASHHLVEKPSPKSE